MKQAQEDEIVLKVRSYPGDVQVDILFSDFAWHLHTNGFVILNFKNLSVYISTYEEAK